MADYTLKGYTGAALEAQLAKIDTQGAKLDTIEQGANNYTLPQATRSQLGGIIAYATVTTMPLWYGRVYVNSQTGMPYIPLATDNYAGALSPNDFGKLKLIWPDCTNVINKVEKIKVDGTALTPDENKAVNIDLSDKLSISSNEWHTASSVSAWCEKYIMTKQDDIKFLDGRYNDDGEHYNIGHLVSGETYWTDIQIPLISETAQGLMEYSAWDNLIDYMSGAMQQRIEVLEAKVDKLVNLLNNQTLITK